jgi:hypothetical protein
MQEIISMNLINKYCLEQRDETTRLISKWLKVFKKYYKRRVSIPLTPDMHPDTIIEDLQMIFQLSNKILNQLDTETVDSNLVYQQLELPFILETFKKNKDFLDKINNPKEIDFIKYTKEDFLNERLNQIWIDLHELCAKETTNVKVIQNEINMIVNYLSSILDINKHNENFNVNIIIRDFYIEMIDFFKVNKKFKDEEDIVCARLYAEKIKLNEVIDEKIN